jgi:ubiquinol-cytochrome c reductase cytochrome b subunit
MLHGAESGVIDRAASGKYAERHRPISEGEAFALTQHEDMPALLPATDTDGYSVKEIKREQRRRQATRFFFIDTLRRPTRTEIEEAADHHLHAMALEDGEHHAIEAEEEHHLAH